MNLIVDSKKTLHGLLIIIGLLLLVNVFGIILKFQFDSSTVRMLVSLFDFDREANIPSFYSALTLIFSSVLLFLIARIHQKNNSPHLPWLGLGFIFLFLSIDEISSIHERIGSILKTLLILTGALDHVDGFIFGIWVIPYGFALLIFVIIYLKFLLALPRRIMYLFSASGAIFVSGAMGFELLAGPHYLDKGIIYSICYTCEESLEMIGIALFIYSLFTYIESKSESLSIVVIKG